MGIGKTTLIQKAKKLCKARELEYADEVYDMEVEHAISVCNERRNFTPNDERLFDEKYENLIVRMVVYSLAKIGAEGQISHSENGISRTYKSGGDYPSDMLNEITPLIRA